MGLTTKLMPLVLLAVAGSILQVSLSLQDVYHTLPGEHRYEYGDKLCIRCAAHLDYAFLDKNNLE